MKKLHIFASATLAMSLFLTACGAEKATDTAASTTTKQETTQSTTATQQDASLADFTASTKSLVDELKKAKDGGKVDWEKAAKLYDEKVKANVQARDKEYSDKVDEQLVAAMTAGKSGSLDGYVVAQLFDKLLQKVAFLQTRHEFKEANESFKDQAKAKADVKEAQDVYAALLKGMIEKRDTAYKTQIVAAIDGGFSEMNAAIDKGDNLAYQLGKQIVDKSIMKAFYLASGAPQGYAYKIEKAAKEGKTTQVEQAEGWAFYQSLIGYVSRFDKDASDFINKSFDLSTDSKTFEADKVNAAFIRALAATAKDEYKQSAENWGKDKAPITSLEGALFLEMLSFDLPKVLGGEEQSKALIANAQKHLEATKAGDQAKATEIYKTIEVELDKLIKYGK